MSSFICLSSVLRLTVALDLGGSVPVPRLCLVVPVIRGIWFSSDIINLSHFNFLTSQNIEGTFDSDLAVSDPVSYYHKWQYLIIVEKQLDCKNGLNCQNILQKKANENTYATVSMFRIN